VDITDQEAMKEAHLLASHLNLMENGHTFMSKLSGVKVIALTEEPKLPRN